MPPVIKAAAASLRCRVQSAQCGVRAEILLQAAGEAMVQGGGGCWTVVPDRGPRARAKVPGSPPALQWRGLRGRRWSWRKRSRSSGERNRSWRDRKDCSGQCVNIFKCY